MNNAENHPQIVRTVRKNMEKPIKNGEPSQATTCFEVLQATLSGAFRDTGAVLRLVLLGAGINALLTPLAVVLLKGGTAGGTRCGGVVPKNLWGLPSGYVKIAIDAIEHGHL